MLFLDLKNFAGCNLTQKSETYRFHLKIVKYFAELTIFIEYQGQRDHTIKNNIEPILEQITGIPDLISMLEMKGINKKMEGDIESNFSYYCELEEF